MKKNILLLSTAFVIAFSTKAQITVVEWDVAGVGTDIQQDQDTLPNVQPGSSGPNATWNFSSVVSHVSYVVNITNPNWTPYGTMMTGANLAADYGGGFYIYLQNNSSGLYAIGQGGDFGLGPMGIKLTDKEQMLKFPCTYNTSFMDTSIIDVRLPFNQQPPIDSIRIIQQKVKNSLVDGYGMITTPLGTFNCLRVKENSMTVTDIYGHIPFVGWQPLQNQVDSTFHFEWWTQNKGMPLMAMDSAYTGEISNVQWLSANPAPGGLNENTSIASINVYPNPANNVITFDLLNAVAEQLIITDVTGRVIETINVQQQIIPVYVNNLAAGTYMYALKNSNNVIINSGKFAVTK